MRQLTVGHRWWRGFGAVAMALTLLVLGRTAVQAQPQKPNILFILVDNLGYGELGAYGGGATRGAPTTRLDTLASEGLRLTNMNMEAQCTPSRSSILTGRYAIRSGTYAVPFGGVADGLTPWEVTLAEALSAAGYATALYGKWPTIDSWVLGPVLKLVAAFEESVKKHPLIPMGTPDPYQPHTAQP